MLASQPPLAVGTVEIGAKDDLSFLESYALEAVEANGGLS